MIILNFLFWMQAHSRQLNVSRYPVTEEIGVCSGYPDLFRYLPNQRVSLTISCLASAVIAIANSEMAKTFH